MALNKDPGLGERAGLLDFNVELDNFNKWVDSVVMTSSKVADDVIKNIALELVERIIVKSPVKTGRSRAGWWKSLVALGGDETTVLKPKFHLKENPTYASSKEIEEGKSKGEFVDHLSHPTDKYVIMINKVHYVPLLEYGYSDQAPAGMVRVSLREMMGKMPEMLKKAYSYMGSYKGNERYGRNIGGYVQKKLTWRME